MIYLLLVKTPSIQGSDGTVVFEARQEARLERGFLLWGVSLPMHHSAEIQHRAASDDLAAQMASFTSL